MRRMLDTPITINKMALPNRLVMPPMATGKSQKGGEISDALCAYYDGKTKGGYLGLVITEHSFISPEGKASFNQLSIAEDSAIPGLKQIVNTIHRNGCKVIAQMNHAGGMTSEEITGTEALAPSAVRAPGLRASFQTPREMCAADIQKVIADFTKAAVRAKEAGYDGRRYGSGVCGAAFAGRQGRPHRRWQSPSARFGLGEARNVWHGLN